MRTVLVIPCLLSTAFAGKVVPVEPMQGQDPQIKGLARAIRIAVDPAVSDDYLFGVSGIAFMATVCANNCCCRDFREPFLRLKPTLDALGVKYEYFEGKDEAIWTRIKASLDDGVPVTAWNLLGDFGDALLVGYDEEKDLVRGWGIKTTGKEPATASLSAWKSGGMYGFLVHRGLKKAFDRAAFERRQLVDVLRLAHRPPLEGG